jgi:hypothetical protein
LEYNLSTVRLLLALFLVNAIGFALKYFELDTFIILLGFRFHLGAVIPLLVLIKKEHIPLMKDSFLHPSFKHVSRVILTFLSTTLLFLSVLFLTNKFEIGDPEYFYEFGLSSIVDYPIYLIWNSIQLIFLFLFFIIIHKSFKNSFFIILVSAILIFAYEFIPLKKMIFNYESIAAFVLLCLILTITIKFLNNVYLFVLLLFSTIWFSLLTFGTSSVTLVNLFFAANYDSWEGFLAVDKIISDFIIPINFFLILVSLLILSLLTKRKLS